MNMCKKVHRTNGWSNRTENRLKIVFLNEMKLISLFLGVVKNWTVRIELKRSLVYSGPGTHIYPHISLVSLYSKKKCLICYTSIS